MSTEERLINSYLKVDVIGGWKIAKGKKKKEKSHNFCLQEKVKREKYFYLLFLISH